MYKAYHGVLMDTIPYDPVSKKLLFPLSHSIKAYNP